MKILNFSYAYAPDFNDPAVWLKRIDFSAGVLASMARHATVIGIYNINYRGSYSKDGVSYHFPNFGKLSLLFPLFFNNYIRKLKPDTVIIHGMNSPWQVVMLRWLMGGELSIILHHHAERPLKGVRRYVQQFADRYIGAYLFCSYEQGQQWVDEKQIRDPRKIKQIMGSSSSFSVIDKATAKAFTGVDGEIIFLWVGDLNANKDPLTLIKAFIYFHQKNQLAKLYMIYPTSDLLQEVESIIISAPDASTFIRLVGKVKHDDLQYWYNSADFIISSSHYEGAGIAVCEALSCGCIPILTSIPSFRMMTDRGRIGLLFEAGSVEDLFIALTKSLTLDRQKQKEEVLKKFKEELSFEANARSILDVIKALPRGFRI